MTIRKSEPAVSVPPRTEHYEPMDAGQIDAPDTGEGNYGEYGWDGDYGESAANEEARPRELGDPGDPDAILRAAVVDALEANACGCAELYVAVRDGEVRFSGRLPTPRMKRTAIRVASAVPGVKAVRSSIARTAGDPESPVVADGRGMPRPMRRSA